MVKARLAKRRRLNLEEADEEDGLHDGTSESVETNPAVPQALSIDLILMGVFKNLTTSELLVCSSVNKVWNFNARTILREKRMCCARISGQKPCKDLQRLDKLLGKSITNLPFFGLSISTDSDANEGNARLVAHKCNGRGILTEWYPNILKKFTLKNLKIFWMNESTCPAVRLIKKIFRDKADSLERLEIIEFPYRISNLRQVFRIEGNNDDEDNHWLPNLKSLNLSSVVTSRIFVDNFNNIVKELVLAAPQLQEIYGITPNLLEVLFYTNKIQAVKEFRCWPNCINEKLCFHFALERPSLKKLIVSPFGERPTRPTEIFTETFKLLLRSCFDTLQELDIELPYFMQMCEWDLGVFPKLRKLKLGYVILRNDNLLTKAFDVTKLFPELQNVEIHPCSTLPREILTSINDEEFRQKLKLFTFPEVTTLRIRKFPQMSQDLFRSWTLMFPNVKHFVMSPCDNLPRYMIVMWGSWPQLESLTFAGVECRFLAGQHYLLDAVLCGLAIEEVAELQGMTSDFLKGLNYIPEQACISALQCLKTLRIEVLHRKSWKRTDSPSAVNLMHISNHLIFSRSPNLNVEIAVTECKTADPLGLPYCYTMKLQHLKSSVKFVDSSKWSLES
ncbi:unnamed protein product [Allacma fusca]|uniref:F-box domain-containing protein n=1 Tax=Allacma fusca TaxID=39272 RepID=A0A8J2J8W1_9HEXA|nr:unnamed protein product [Allacma fusca]